MHKHRVLEGIGSAFLSQNKKRKEKYRDHLNAQAFPSEIWFRGILLRNRIKYFHRNFPLGIYFLDFYFRKQKIAVEIDGKSHHKKDQIYKDKIRDAYIEGRGIEVIRINAFDETKAQEVISYLLTAPRKSRAGSPRPQEKPKGELSFKSHAKWLESLTVEEKAIYRKSSRKSKKSKIGARKEGRSAVRAYRNEVTNAPSTHDSVAACYLARQNPSTDLDVARPDATQGSGTTQIDDGAVWLMELFEDWKGSKPEPEKKKAPKKKRLKKKEAEKLAPPVIVYKKRSVIR